MKKNIDYIKETIQSKTLIYTVLSILINGKDRVSLETTRNGQINKVKKRLLRKYKSTINKPLVATSRKNVPKIIWICWLQGLEEAPLLVNICVESIQKNFSSYEIVVITKENMNQYIKLPSFIESKVNSGIISYTHLSDIIRLELLTNYGGIWIDATVLVTQNEAMIPKYFLESELFLFEKLKPGKDGHPISVSSWYICSRKENPILLRVKELIYEYWERNNKLTHYFLIHIFLQIVLDTHTEDGVKYKFDSGKPHALLLNLNKEFDEQKFLSILEYCPIHKLSYKSYQSVGENLFMTHILDKSYKEYL